MKVLTALFLTLLIFTGKADAQKAEVVKLQKIMDILETKGDNIHIINFWATWCGPCIAEMPLFEKLNAEARPDVRISLISLDLDLDPDPEKVYKFVSRKKLTSEVLILDEKDPGAWIDKVDKEWSGALPATIVINRRTGKRVFTGRELKAGDLERLIEEVKTKS